MTEQQAYARPTITMLGKLADITLAGASSAGNDCIFHNGPNQGYFGSVSSPGCNENTRRD